MSSSTSTTTKLCDVLSLLDAYSHVHERGQNEQKACTWKLTVARHNKGRHGALINGVLLADDVREELRAIKVLKRFSEAEAEPEPELLVEEEDNNDASEAAEMKKAAAKRLTDQKKQFVLVDAIECYKNKTTSADGGVQEESNSGGVDAEGTNTGLRRRKGKNNDDKEAGSSSNNKKWSVEVVQEEAEEKMEEERLRTANPLDLFGAMPPQELRKAQKEAQKALVSYVEAANLVAAIQERLLEQGI